MSIDHVYSEISMAIADGVKTVDTMGELTVVLDAIKQQQTVITHAATQKWKPGDKVKFFSKEEQDHHREGHPH